VRSARSRPSTGPVRGTARCLRPMPSQGTLRWEGRRVVRVAVHGANHAARAEDFLREYLRTQAGWITVTADEPSAPGAFSSTRLWLLRTWIAAVLPMTVVAVVPSTLLDRGTWERTLSRLRRRRGNPWQVDIDAQSTAILARAHAVGGLRFASWRPSPRRSQPAGFSSRGFQREDDRICCEHS
jgi:hypothetical protein